MNAFSRARAFTLLEMLVVLTLLGLVVGVAGPRLFMLYERMRFNLERDSVLLQLSGLSLLAYRHSTALEFVAWPLPADQAWPSEVLLSLPAEWQVRAEKPLRFSALGICSGGEVWIEWRGEREKVRLPPPRCEVAP